MGALRIVASQAAGFTNDESGSHGRGPLGETEPKETAEDDAARRRATLLKRYGDRSASSGPKPVKRDSSAGDPAAEDAEKTAANEADHNEIWGDCEFSMNVDGRQTLVRSVAESTHLRYIPIHRIYVPVFPTIDLLYDGFYSVVTVKWL